MVPDMKIDPQSRKHSIKKAEQVFLRKHELKQITPKTSWNCSHDTVSLSASFTSLCFFSHVPGCRTSLCTLLALQPAEGHVWSGRGRERDEKLAHLLVYFCTLESGPEVGSAEVCCGSSKYDSRSCNVQVSGIRSRLDLHSCCVAILPHITGN